MNRITALHMGIIGVVVIIGMVVLSNPLSLLALLLMPQQIAQNPAQALAEMFGRDNDDCNCEDEDDEPKMGFTAKLKEKD